MPSRIVWMAKPLWNFRWRRKTYRNISNYYWTNSRRNENIRRNWVELTSKIARWISWWKRYQINGRRQRPVTLVALVKKRLIQIEPLVPEEIRRKACEKLGKTSKWNAEEKADPVAKKSRRSGSETLDFLREKMGARQAEGERHAKMQQKYKTRMQPCQPYFELEQNGWQVTEQSFYIHFFLSSSSQFSVTIGNSPFLKLGKI